MILFYRIITTFLYPILVVIIFFRRLTGKEDKIRFKEKIFIKNFNVNRSSEEKLIWFHCASIGEFKSILPIIDELNKNYKNIRFLITTVTLSSANLASDELKKFDNVIHRFFPVDVKFIIRGFLHLWKPSAIFLVDSEIWPNLVLTSQESKIPLCVINARLTKKSFKRWMLFPKSTKKIFQSINLFLVSNLETKNFLNALKLKNVIYNGNIKLFSKIDKKQIYNPNEKILLNKRFWVAASTHDSEENFCLKTHLKIKKKYDDIITIIFPRHIERAKQIKKISENMGLRSQLLNKNERILENKEIIIVNTFGELQKYFYLAKSVFIGKSLIKRLENEGGQNPIEAAKLGCKIYHGPHVNNFKEIYDIFDSKGISTKVEDPIELHALLLKDLENTTKNINNSSNLINNLGEKVFKDTMKNVNKILSNVI
jgi:3-deoxy-D-manno-octulosonic-acid transferase